MSHEGTDGRATPGGAAAGGRKSSSGPTTPGGDPPARRRRGPNRMGSDLSLVLLDIFVPLVAYSLIYSVRFDFGIPDRYAGPFVAFLPVAVVAHVLGNWVWGLYGELWRQASIREARRILLSGSSVGAVLTIAYGYVARPRPVPLSVVVMGALLTTMLFGAVRFHARLFPLRRGDTQTDATRLIVIGAGEADGAILRELRRTPDSGLLPVAVLDDDPRKQNRSLLGVPVVGGIDELADAVHRYRADQALLAIPSADGEFVRLVANAADDVGVTLKVLPGVSELVNSTPRVRDVRDLVITDLLGRRQVNTDLEAVGQLLAGRRVLITGGGGSIGSEVARQVAGFGPSELVLLDHDETHLYDAARHLPDAVQVLADIRDRDVLDAVFAERRPDVVFHAAAHKHVPLLEHHPCEAVRTNVEGTRNVVDMAARHGTERFVFISTDKAVQPTSVMGASKRVGEQIVLTQRSHTMRTCAVRFGNVLGSRGSVIPHFLSQIEEGGPVTVTDPRMTRYFMTIPEAVQLVLQAASFSDGGEVYMLEMGEPIRILDLAERLIRLSGHRVGVDVDVEIVGTRPGEKLREDLYSPEEIPHRTPHPSVYVLYVPVLDVDDLHRDIDRLAGASAANDREGVAAGLFALAQRKADIIALPPSEFARLVE